MRPLLSSALRSTVTVTCRSTPKAASIHLCRPCGSGGGLPQPGVPRRPHHGATVAGLCHGHEAWQRWPSRCFVPVETGCFGGGGSCSQMAAYTQPVLNSVLCCQDPLSAVPAVACVVHLSPLEVVRLPAYRQWLESFGPAAQHVLVAESIASPAPIMRKSAILQARARGCTGTPGTESSVVACSTSGQMPMPSSRRWPCAVAATVGTLLSIIALRPLAFPCRPSST